MEVKQVGRSKPRNKKKKRKVPCFDFFKKDILKVKKTLLQQVWQNILENQRFQRRAKIIKGGFYEMDFIEGIVILVTVDEMYKLFSRVCPLMLIHLIRPCLIRRQASTPCHNFLLPCFIKFRLSM